MFRTLMLSLGGVAASFAIATTASAQSASAAREPVNRADLQCMAIMAIGAGTTEQGSVEQLGLAVGMAYYLGRLEGRAPSVNWLAEFTDYLTGDFEDEVKVQADRCGTEMEAFGGRLTGWGERMQAYANKLSSGKQGLSRP